MRLRGECEHGKYDSHTTHYNTLGQVMASCPGGPVFDGEWVDWCETHDNQRKQLHGDVDFCCMFVGVCRCADRCVKGRRIIAMSAIKGDETVE